MGRSRIELGIGDVDLSPVPDLVEAYLRLGRSEEAALLAGEYADWAAEKGQPWALARAARSRGLTAPDEQLDEWFEEALRLHARTPDLFETGRTHLAYGARLRRVRQRVRAREELRAGLELFDRLGAERWAEQASAELAATGETARRRVPSTLDDLTPQELQIALLLARGQTTREAAASLFLSPKTIEYHPSQRVPEARHSLARRARGCVQRACAGTQLILVSCRPTRLLCPAASTSRGTSTVTRCQSLFWATSVLRPSTATRRGSAEGANSSFSRPAP